MLDPQDFVISQKRKKYRFALFANSPLCYEVEQWQQRPVDVIELGAGTGLFCVELAAARLDQQFVAVDVKADRLQKGANEAQKRGLTNITFLRARADQITDLFAPSSLIAIWSTFADPFPKKRSARRRMTHAEYLQKYATVLRGDGTLHIKHDNLDFFTWSLEQLVASKWQINELSFDLHGSDLPSRYKILTTYEKRWLEKGRTTYLSDASFPR